MTQLNERPSYYAISFLLLPLAAVLNLLRLWERHAHSREEAERELASKRAT